MTILNYICIFCILIICSNSQNIVCYTSGINQCEAVYRYMYGTANGYYLSIDPDFPFINSSTIYLISQGWNGLNLLSNDPGYDFNVIKFNFNLASQVALAVKVSQRNLTNAPHLQNRVGSILMTMQKICHKYLLQKPTFLVLDIKNMIGVINTNNWKNQKCRPELIIGRKKSFHLNQSQIQDKLIEKGYTLMQNFNQTTQLKGNYYWWYNNSLDLYDRISVFVDSQYLIKYQDILDENQNKTQLYSQNYTSYIDILNSFAKKLLSDYQYKDFLRLKKQGYSNQYFAQYWSVHGSDINITQLVYNLRYTRPTILIMQYNPLTSKLIVDKTNTSYENRLIIGQHQYFHLVHNVYYNVTNKSIMFNIYLYNHRFLEQKQQIPLYLSVEQKIQNKVISNQSNNTANPGQANKTKQSIKSNSSQNNKSRQQKIENKQKQTEIIDINGNTHNMNSKKQIVYVYKEKQTDIVKIVLALMLIVLILAFFLQYVRNRRGMLAFRQFAHQQQMPSHSNQPRVQSNIQLQNQSANHGDQLMIS